MHHGNSSSARYLLALLCLPLLLAMPIVEAFAQLERPLNTVRSLPAGEPGANAFARFNRTEKGHSLTNSCLLAMVSHYMYPHAYDPNPGNNFEVFRTRAREKFQYWGMQKIDTGRSTAASAARGPITARSMRATSTTRTSPGRAGRTACRCHRSPGRRTRER